MISDDDVDREDRAKHLTAMLNNAEREVEKLRGLVTRARNLLERTHPHSLLLADLNKEAEDSRD